MSFRVRSALILFAVTAGTGCGDLFAPPPQLYADPQQIDLAAAQFVDGVANVSITLANVGEGNIDIEEVRWVGEAPAQLVVSMTDEEEEMESGQIATLTLTFSEADLAAMDVDRLVLAVDAKADWLQGCGAEVKTSLTLDIPIFLTSPEVCDADGDGFTPTGCEGLPEGDCDDEDPLVHPDAIEVCDGLDNDCDALVDDGAPGEVRSYTDRDGDGFGDTSTRVDTCEMPPGNVGKKGDCDDRDADVNPDATEVCDGVDNDCDGLTDSAADDAFIAYLDEDADGFGNEDGVYTGCELLPGYALLAGDCDDTDAAVSPAAPEVCNGIDDDCDDDVDEAGAAGELYWLPDADADGFGDATTVVLACEPPVGFVSLPGDCDDTQPDVHPGAAELCDEQDRDCDGDPVAGSSDGSDWYADADADGWGTGMPVAACEQPTAFSAVKGDCDDSDPTRLPGATEVCNGRDDDCDFSVDEGLGTDSYYPDSDHDGYGWSAGRLDRCAAPAGHVEAGGDCNDAAYEVHPGAPETCNERDDDCDGLIDESPTDASAWHRDADGDGFGSDASSSTSCDPGEGWLPSGGDCDDADPNVHPGVDEVCDGVDEDCDGVIDNGAPGADPWYVDADRDGFGGDDTLQYFCSTPTDRIPTGGDCVDDDPKAFPGASEQCNERDDDCDGVVDEDVVDRQTWFRDADGDGYGDSTDSLMACAAPNGYVADNLDCNDGDELAHPGADELCGGGDEDCDGTVDEAGASGEVAVYPDLDFDGYGGFWDDTAMHYACTVEEGLSDNSDDCDDDEAFVNPGGTELCDGLDNDCDGDVDEEGSEAAWYADDDDDEYGAGPALYACEQPPGFVLASDDCDDNDNDVHPHAEELCDGIDQDCDGVVDDDATGGTVWHEDMDGDGLGHPQRFLVACEQPARHVANDDDCDDSNPAVGDGWDWYKDGDRDAYGNASSVSHGCQAPGGYVGNDDDCDDGRSTVYPGAPETCNGRDDDCDGGVDESAVDPRTWYADRDLDSFGNANDTARACSVPTGFVADSADCDDTDATTYPGAPETCDGEDDDCDGVVDDGATDTRNWYKDFDSDTYGDATQTSRACSPPSGYVASSTDCDDHDRNVNPGAAEVCNLVDDDCDGTKDEGVTSTWYLDQDLDAYGRADNTRVGCAAAGWSSNDDDCNDANGLVHPGAGETCNGSDDDCDGLVDDADPDVDSGASWYKDADGDGWGGSSSVTTCNPPNGYVSNDDDCNDADVSVHPGATEVCNSRDDDCDGLVDDGAQGGVPAWVDADGDKYGDPARATTVCTLGPGYSNNDDDCNDANPAVYPNAPEVCNGVDDDCDGTKDEGTGTEWFRDRDGDGYGNDAEITVACTDPGAEWVEIGGDCNDKDPAINPGAREQCDFVDNNCDGIADDSVKWYRDRDFDGWGDDEVWTWAPICNAPWEYVRKKGDCDDNAWWINPGQQEWCDDIDNDCNGEIDDDPEDATYWWPDEDFDGWGANVPAEYGCPDWTQWGWTSWSDGDCDDHDWEINPGAGEPCDGRDNDCSGYIDDGESCPCSTIDWYEDHAYVYCYGGFYDFFDYDNARNGCRAYGYDLVSISSDPENDYVWQMTQDLYGGDWWLGATDRGTEGTWKWADGTTWSYTAWAPGEPNNMNNEDCLMMWSDGSWNDITCGGLFGPWYPFVCEAGP